MTNGRRRCDVSTEMKRKVKVCRVKAGFQGESNENHNQQPSSGWGTTVMIIMSKCICQMWTDRQDSQLASMVMYGAK